MLLRLLLLFTLVPLAELALLVWLDRRTSLGITLAVVLSTGFLGAALARWQGLKVWTAFRAELAAGRLPANAAIDGLLVLVAAAFLLTPGLLTDTAGFLLLVPAVRAFVRPRLLARLRRKVEVRMRGFRGPGGGEVLDAEFRRADTMPIEHRAEP